MRRDGDRQPASRFSPHGFVSALERGGEVRGQQLENLEEMRSRMYTHNGLSCHTIKASHGVTGSTLSGLGSIRRGDTSTPTFMLTEPIMPLNFGLQDRPHISRAPSSRQFLFFVALFLEALFHEDYVNIWY